MTRLALLRMRVQTSLLLGVGAALSLPSIVSAQVQAAVANNEVDRSKECNSACLKRFADDYLAALSAHNPWALKQVAPNFRAAENSHAVALGDNVWKTVINIRPPKSYFTDPVAGQVMVLGVLEMRANEPFIYAIRLKVESGLLSESEMMVTSDKIAGQHFRPDLMPALQQKLDSPVTGKPLSRAELTKATAVFLGTESGTALSAADDCQRTENGEAPDGGRASGPSCSAAGAARAMRGLRMPLIDTEKGVAVIYKFTDFSYPTPRDPPPNAAPEKTPIFYYRPLSFYEMQIVKINDAKYQAYAMFMNAQENGVLSPFPR